MWRKGWTEVLVLNRVLRKEVVEEIPSEQRPEGSEGASFAEIWEESSPGRRN